MRCCITPMSDGKKVLLVFKREELLYDIKNYAYIEEPHHATPDGACPPHGGGRWRMWKRRQDNTSVVACRVPMP